MRLNSDALAASLATAVLVAGLALGSRAASGGDSYGYVSQAALWRQGSLVQPVPLLQKAAWPGAAETLAPLGYRPARRAFAIVPTYAPGLPILMAIAGLFGGACAVYAVVPVCAALLVWLTYRLGLRTGERIVAAGAAVLVATSPTLLFMTMWPMSDVPVSMFWTAAILSAAAGGGRGRHVLTGILTGVAILIRPNLLLVAIVPAGLVLQHASADRAGRWRSVVLFAAGVVPFVAGVAFLNAFLYGSPLESGYGGLNRLYAAGRVPTNLVRHMRWLYESQGPYLFVFAAGLVAALRRRQHPVLTWGALLALLVWMSYLPYHAYSEWWYLRFLLPAFPILCVLAVYGVWTMLAGLGARPRAAITAAFVVAAAAQALGFAMEKEIAGLGEGEQRAVEVGSFARGELPANAIILSGHHSGSLRYYSARTTLRYDRLDPQWLDRTIEMLRAEGLHPYAVLEAWEEPIFRAHFAGQTTVTRLTSPPLAALDSNVPVRVYDLAVDAPPPATKAIRHLPRSQCREP